MTTAQNILDVARSQIGYVETGSNRTKYWAEIEPGLQGNPWCAAFVSWVFKHAGLPLPAMGKSYGFVYVPNAVNYAKAHGLWDESGHYAPGDIVCYGNGAHTGIIATDNGTTMAVYEGNTSPDNSAGSQTNGGGVYLRHRPHSDWVKGVIKTSRLLTTTTTDTEDELMALTLLNPATKADATAASGLSSIWAYTFLNYKMLVELLKQAGVDVDESAIAAQVLAGLTGPLKDAVTAAVTAGGSVDQITEAVVARLTTAIQGA